MLFQTDDVEKASYCLLKILKMNTGIYKIFFFFILWDWSNIHAAEKCQVFLKFLLGLCNITGGKENVHLAPNEPAQCSDDLGSIAQQKAICAGAYLQKWGHNHPLTVDPVYFVQFLVLAAYVKLCTFSGFFFPGHASI